MSSYSVFIMFHMSFMGARMTTARTRLIIRPRVMLLSMRVKVDSIARIKARVSGYLSEFLLVLSFYYGIRSESVKFAGIAKV